MRVKFFLAMGLMACLFSSSAWAAREVLQASAESREERSQNDRFRQGRLPLIDNIVPDLAEMLKSFGTTFTNTITIHHGVYHPSEPEPDETAAIPSGKH